MALSFFLNVFWWFSNGFECLFQLFWWFSNGLRVLFSFLVFF